jgi:2-polyprenyl-3-methyl-5-hydroxy-6-metoxy-1,4-benzoquinol methylase
MACFRSDPASFSRDPEAPDFAGGTIKHVGKHALDFLDKTVPRFREMIVGRSVLDYGCGMGDQAVALSLLGAKSVTGYDPYPRFPTTGPSGVTFTASLPTEKFDIVLSSSSLEHFADPERDGHNDGTYKPEPRDSVGGAVVLA